MPLRHRRQAVLPLHIRVRGAGVGNVETTVEVRDDEVEFGVGEIDADARPRALGKRHEFGVHLARSAGGRGEPALGTEGLGVGEGVRVLVVDVGAGRDDGLSRVFGQ